MLSLPVKFAIMSRTAYHNVTDEMLFAYMQKGDEQSFKELFFRYYALLIAYAHRYVGDEDAKEITQDLMVWIWEYSETIQIEVSIKSYLFKAVKNRCLTLIAHNAMKQRVEYQLHESLRGHCDDPDFYVVEELSARINEALSRLPETYREAFEMNRFSKMTYQQIGDQLQISPKTVDYRIQQALKILRKELKDYLPLLFFLY